MVSYQYLGDKRRSAELSDSEAARMIGSRVLCGFDSIQRWVQGRNGELFQIIYFQSEITGKVWAVYF